LSTASLAGRSLEGCLRRGRELGFGSIEVLGFEGERHSQGDLCGFAFAERSAEEAEQLREHLAGYGRISVHAPFIMVPLLAANPGIRREAWRQVLACIRGMAAVGGQAVTVHLNGVPFWSSTEWRAAAVRTLRELGKMGAEAGGVRIALETGCPSAEEEFCALIEEAGHPCLGACVDTGHIAGYYPAALRGTAEGIAAHNDILNRMVARLGGRVVLFHAHDNRREDFRDHRAPGRGIIDWPRLMRTVGQAGVTAPRVLELEEPDFEAALAEGRRCLVEAM
jgi:sugar phosphate isomerase/epimerase